MDTLLAFIWAPLVLYGLSVGLALLAERILRLELPNALVAPVGLALLIAIVMPVYRLGSASGVVLAVTLPCALLGFVIASRSLPARLNPGSAGVAAVVGYALYMAPVALTGHWTWPGYNFVNDTAPNFLYTDLLSRQGMTLPAVVDSTTAVIQAAPINLGYPVGAHGLLATVQPLTGAALPAVYHPIIATVTALAAMAMAQLARRAGLSALPAAVAGVLPLGAVLLYRYGLHGSIKEELVVALMATAAALGREALDRELSVRLAVLIALCAAALLHVFSAVGAAYALVLGVLLLAAGLAEGRGIAAIGRLAAVGVAIAVVAVAVNISDVTSFAKHAEDTFASEGGSSTAYLGHLLRPLPLAEAAGSWFARDYRAPVAPAAVTENAIVIVAIGLLALAGIVSELRRRRPAGLLLLIPLAVVAAALSPELSPYAAGKLLVVLSPAILLLAAIGGFTLLAQRVRLLQVAAGLALSVVIVGVLVSDSLGYRMATLAPPDRLDAMTDAADHADGGGLWLVNEWEEFAKYFMRDIKVNAAFEAESPRPAELRKPRPIFGRYYDLDALTLEYVDSFAGIIKRRSPGASRPPASFKLMYVNDYYEVWRRRDAPTVIEHLPLQRRHVSAARPNCERVRALAAGARPGDRLIAASQPEVILLDPLHAGLRPPGWVRNVDPPGTVTPTTPGEMRFVSHAGPGRYRVWLNGSFGRPTRVYVDGRRVGAADEINTPGQWERLGEIELEAAEHRIRLERPGASPAPGNAWRGVLGPVALERVAPLALTTVAPGRASQLCRRESGLDRAGASMTEQEPTGPPLEPTGERLVPELQHGELVHAEHLARYQLAAELAASRRVLDAACGEGYGTALLAAGGAVSATGIDSDEQTVLHARATYPGVTFELGDIHRLPFDDRAFDLVVSFETIEHVRKPNTVLDEFRRVLNDDGLLLISTPNKHRYLVENEFHEREFFHEEFVELLSTRFANVEVLLQQNWLASAVLSTALAEDAAGVHVAGARFAKLTSVAPGGELYTVALCRDGQIPSYPPVVVAAGLDEAHELARRLVAAEGTAEMWHREYQVAAEGWHGETQKLRRVYDSVWWRMTAPLRWVADRARGRRG